MPALFSRDCQLTLLHSMYTAVFFGNIEMLELGKFHVLP